MVIITVSEEVLQKFPAAFDSNAPAYQLHNTKTTNRPNTK